MTKPIGFPRKPRITHRHILDTDGGGPQANGKSKPRSHPVTVCIAAICEGFAEMGPCIIGAADRKITAGDVEFEPAQSKIYQFNERIVALVAGDADAQTELCNHVFLKMGGPNQRTDGPMTVESVVDLYCRELGDFCRRQAERKVLFPLGLNMKSFLRNQGKMDCGIVDQVMRDIKRERASIKTIICGVDRLGPHVYTVDHNGHSRCNDGIGFSAIGDGEWHAESQFMFAHYTRHWKMGRALSLLYTAKKRAEAAPGVGKETDIFFIAFEFGYLHSEICDVLKLAYDLLRDGQEKTNETANKEVENYLIQFQKRTPGEAPKGHPKPETSPEKNLPENPQPNT